MSWKVAEAKQRLSEVIRDAQKEPQIITNRETPVAAVLRDFEGCGIRVLDPFR